MATLSQVTAIAIPTIIKRDNQYQKGVGVAAEQLLNFARDISHYLESP